MHKRKTPCLTDLEIKSNIYGVRFILYTSPLQCISCPDSRDLKKMRVHQERKKSTHHIYVNNIRKEGYTHRWRGYTHRWRGYTHRWRGYTHRWRGYTHRWRGYRSGSAL